MILALCALGTAGAQDAPEAPPPDAPPPDAPPPDAQPSIDEMIRMLQDRHSALAARVDELEAQNRALGEQRDQLATQAQRLQDQSNSLEQQAELIQQQNERLSAQNDAIQSLQTRVDQATALAEGDAELSDEELAIRSRLESLESAVADVTQRETTTSYDAADFPGAIPVPGTSAALRIGGYVKMNYVQSLSALGSQNRFIVGTIPTRGPGGSDAEAALTAQQSRLNFELREDTNAGQLRAFLEGDFAGDGDTFRLRHAFGQFRDFMAGKTWTTFMDLDASPEEVDFEGVNGRINVRQTQVRWFPSIGQRWDLELAAEDPAPEITGGDGLSQTPDLVASIRSSVAPTIGSNDWSVKSSLLLRKLRARWEQDPNVKQEATGWALNVSARRPLLAWDARDNLAFQFSYGSGYGRYINDLGTVGGQDAVFDDATGEMKPLDVFATYMSFQKWWREGLRSTFIASYVDIENRDFQPDDAYDKTWRVSGNLIWSPAPRIDVGGELLWGAREDKDGSSGDASQLQISAKYRF